MSPLISGVTVHCQIVLSLPIRLLTLRVCAQRQEAISPLTATLNTVCACSSMCNNYQNLCVCALVYVCVCDSSSSPLHSWFSKAIGDQWRLKVTNHPSSPTLPSNPPPPPPLPPLPTCAHAHPGKGLQGPGVSFIFGTTAPVEGLQGIRGSIGQLLLCFNWHYHFSGLTEMDHPAGPGYCWYKSGGDGRGGEGVGLVGTM